jgi:hypothetical protein
LAIASAALRGWRALLVVDLDADAEGRGHRGRRRAQPGRVLGQGGVPVVGVGDAADRHHDAHACIGEVLHDVAGHAARDTVQRGGVGGAVEQVERVDGRSPPCR